MDPTQGGPAALRYRRLRAEELDVVTSLDLDPVEIERFLGPLADIVDAVRRGPAHSVVALEASGALVGFYVVHPSPRDPSSWWLGWLAVDRNWQGRGFGVQAMAHVLRHLGGIPACRRVRLLVAADNLRARRIYRRAGFRGRGSAPGTNELVLELALPSITTAGQVARENLLAAAARARRVFRHRRLRLVPGPHPAWIIGVERGPPVVAGWASARQS